MGILGEFFSYEKKPEREEDFSPYRLVFEKRATLQTLLITAVTLLLLTVVAMAWPWEELPRSRPLDMILKLTASALFISVLANHENAAAAASSSAADIITGMRMNPLFFEDRRQRIFINLLSSVQCYRDPHGFRELPCIFIGP